MAVKDTFEERMQRWRASPARRRQQALVDIEVALDKAAALVAQDDARAWEAWLGLFVKKLVDLGRERGVSEQDLAAFITVVYEQGARRLIKLV